MFSGLSFEGDQFIAAARLFLYHLNTLSKVLNPCQSQLRQITLNSL